MSESEIVKRIIESVLLQRHSVSKHYVVEEIRNRISPTRLYNKALSNNKNRSDSAGENGIKNLKIGAEKIFRDSIRSLKPYFIVDENGLISRNPVSPESSGIPGFTHNGVFRSLLEWSEMLGVTVETLRLRVKKGWTPEKIVAKVGPNYNRNRISKMLLPLCSKEWVERKKIKERFIEIVDKEEAIHRYNLRAAVVDKYRSKKQSRRRIARKIPTDDEKIKVGATTLFNSAIKHLCRKGVIQIEVEEKREKVRLTPNPEKDFNHGRL